MAAEYCSPEMAALMREFGELTDELHVVHEVTLRNASGQVVARWYRPVQRDVKGQLKDMILKGHELGYTEAVGDWG